MIEWYKKTVPTDLIIKDLRRIKAEEGYAKVAQALTVNMTDAQARRVSAQLINTSCLDDMDWVSQIYEAL